jgi:hypothetical protein
MFVTDLNLSSCPQGLSAPLLHHHHHHHLSQADSLEHPTEFVNYLTTKGALT